MTVAEVANLDVGGHVLHIERHGQIARDAPVFLFLHGGPGHWYNHARHSRWFDLSMVQLIAFDQRGCGRSQPLGSLVSNTPEDLTADIDRVADHFGIGRFFIVGGSWGATLALLYAQRTPERCRGLVLRGPWLPMWRSIQWIWGGWAGELFPRQWSEFTEILGENRADAITGYRVLLNGDNTALQREAARRWINWEECLCCFRDRPRLIGSTEEISQELLVMSRFENYFVSEYSELGDMLLTKMARLSSVPGSIVQGRFDFLCPPKGAEALAAAWPRCRLKLVNSGHKGDHDPMYNALKTEIMRASREW
jgi:proline iminopeptidase